MIQFGNDKIKEIYVGSDRIKEVYHEGDLVWRHLTAYLFAWGENGKYGKLGLGITGGNYFQPEVISDTWTMISAGSDHSLGIMDGKLYAWGYNAYGQLGDGTLIQRESPTQVGSENTWSMISAGGEHSLGISDGKLYVWGRNTNGQLGDGTTTEKYSPTQIGSGNTWTMISGGDSHSLGIMEI